LYSDSKTGVNIKSATFRVVYHADGHAVEMDSRVNALMYLVNESTEVECSFEKQEHATSINLQSSEVKEALSELEAHRLIEIKVESTIGGDEKTTYLLTDKGVSKAKLLIGDSDIEETIESIVSEYGDYPISNLLNNIKIQNLHMSGSD